MSFPPSKNSDNPPVSCQVARNLIGIILLTTALAVFLMMGDLFIHAFPGPAPAARWMRVLNLTSPALWPAGTSLRHPEAMHPAITLHHVPGWEALP